jgi:hypothetical protein
MGSPACPILALIAAFRFDFGGDARKPLISAVAVLFGGLVARWIGRGVLNRRRKPAVTAIVIMLSWALIYYPMGANHMHAADIPSLVTPLISAALLTIAMCSKRWSAHE